MTVTWLAAHDGVVREEADGRRAVVAAMSTASALGLEVDDTVVLSDSNRLVVRLTPCDVVARVTPMAHFGSAEREVELVKRLAPTDSPVATLEARVSQRVFVVTASGSPCGPTSNPYRLEWLPPAEYAQVLEHLHAGLRQIDVTTPHVMDRVAAVQQDVASRDVTPDLADADRALLADTLRDLSGRSPIGAHPSSCCTASRTRGTFSTRRTGCSSSTSRTPPTGRSSTTSPGCPTRSPSAIRTLTKTSSASAAASCWRSSRCTVGVATTSTRAADDQAWRSSTRCETVRRGRRSMRSSGSAPPARSRDLRRSLPVWRGLHPVRHQLPREPFQGGGITPLETVPAPRRGHRRTARRTARGPSSPVTGQAMIALKAAEL